MDSDGHRPMQGERLIVASAALFASGLLWILAAVLNFLGPVGPVTAGVLAWAAMGLDIVGVSVLAWIYLELARAAEGLARVRRRWIAWGFLLWCALSAYWRFVLPFGSGTNTEDLFAGLLGAYPAGLAIAQGSPLLVVELFGIWTGAAVLFAAVHALIALDYRQAGPEEWVRGLPVYAWLVAAAVSLAGTAVVVFALLPVLGGGESGTGVAVGATLKLLVAPNLFLSGYVGSFQLGLTVARMGRTPAAT